MGSGASSSVKSVSINNGTDEDTATEQVRPSSVCSRGKSSRTRASKAGSRPNSTGSRHRKIDCEQPQKIYLESELEKYKSLLAKAEEKSSKYEDLAKQREEQLCELEGSCLEQQDQVQQLEQQLEFLEREKLEAAGTPDCEETLKAKDHYMEQLQKETNTAQEQLQKLRTKFKKKLRILNKQLTESKQASSLQSFELKGELSRLSEENKQLREQLRENGAHKLPNDVEEAASTQDDGRTHVILELSSKVSEQDARITDLENKLTDKNKLIAQLEKQVKSHGANGQKVKVQSSGLDALNTHQSPSDTSVSSWQHDDDIDQHWKSNLSSVPASDFDTVSNKQTASTWAGQSDDRELSELKQIAQEMKQLKKKKKKATSQAEVKDGGDMAGDSRESSGTSRDSGVIAFEDIGQYDLGFGATKRGLANVTDHNSRQSSANSRHSKLSDNEMDNISSKPSSAQSHNSLTSDLGEDDDDFDLVSNCSDEARATPLNISNIRRISASKLRKKAKNSYDSDKDYTGRHGKSITKQNHLGRAEGKPPIYKARDRSLEDADSLIRSIDDDDH